jgi:hypothetical protein
MSFQTYLENIQVKTGKNLEDFNALVIKAGLILCNLKSGMLVEWQKKEYDLVRVTTWRYGLYS